MKFLFFLILSALSLFSMGWLSHVLFLQYQDIGFFRIGFQDNSTKLNDNVYRLQNDFNSWYYYNISNINKDLTDEQLKQQGGVCWHASDWYIRQLTSLGYNTQSVFIKVNADMNHEFAVASDVNGNFCIMDQYQVHCWS